MNEQGTAGIQYCLDLLAALPSADGLYIEPTGEGAEADKQIWSKHVDALDRLLKQVQAARPEFESAIAIGRFNSRDYRQSIHRMAPDRLHWFWAWGSPRCQMLDLQTSPSQNAQLLNRQMVEAARFPFPPLASGGYGHAIIHKLPSLQSGAVQLKASGQ